MLLLIVLVANHSIRVLKKFILLPEHTVKLAYKATLQILCSIGIVNLWIIGVIMDVCSQVKTKGYTEYCIELFSDKPKEEPKDEQSN